VGRADFCQDIIPPLEEELNSRSPDNPRYGGKVMSANRVSLILVLFLGVFLPRTDLLKSQDCMDYSHTLHLVGGVDTPGSAEGVAVSGSHAYVADGDSGLQVVDVIDPQSPVIAGSVDTPDYAYGVAVSGSYAFVADGNSGLQVVDVTDPQSPVIAGSVDTPGEAHDVAVSGSYAYVADWNSGLQVIDISDPQSPVIVGSVDTPNRAYGVAVSGSYAYVADGNSGLQVIDHRGIGRYTEQGIWRGRLRQLRVRGRREFRSSGGRHLRSTVSGHRGIGRYTGQSRGGNGLR
jgi:hypothetical protein